MKTLQQNILDQSVQYIKSVGPKRAQSFSKVGLNTIKDLLFYFPSRHLDRTTILNCAKAFGYAINGYDGELTIIGKVEDREKRRYGKKEILKVSLRDNTGFFECVWFQGVKYFHPVFESGKYFAISGKPSIDKYGKLQFIHPDFDRITEEESDSFLHTGKIIPFYRIPKELKETNIGDLSLRRIINYAVENYADNLQEILNDEIINEHNLLGLKDAVKNYHFPESQELLSEARTRFKFEEIFFIELLVALRKHNYSSQLSGNRMEIKTDLVSEFLKTLPFRLTSSQLKVLSEIKNDMLSDKPMNRLLQGDVGSGKTIVALISMLIAVDNGFQAAMMAPTEILADQHAKRITELLHKISTKRKIKVNLLLGGQKKSVRDKHLEDIELKEADIIIGTHALIEEKVKFNNLGLIVVDEQHRFGVKQRGILQAKGNVPDVLIMSATPIPRTLSMTVYGDLDNSIIDEMPGGRKTIKTVLRGENKLQDIYKFIIDKSKEGYQSFLVYPLVEESEKLELKAATKLFEELKDTFLKNLRVGLIHGRMKWQEKETVMMEFKQKMYDVLISTTVIEVGIDIPDANIILINDAHRFGLSQLHQLRGRVGRSNKQAYCILVTKDELVKYNSTGTLNLDYLSSTQLEKYKSSVRLQSMVRFSDGFKIAEIDLKLRGPGNIFGTEQSGFPDLKHINIIEDTSLITDAKRSAFKIIEEDPGLRKKNNLVLKHTLQTNFKDHLSYASIG